MAAPDDPDLSPAEPHDGAAPVDVRPMTVSDVDAALAMFTSVAEEGLWLGSEGGFDPAERRTSWLANLSDPTRRSYVATRAGAVVGNASIHLASYGVADISMAVAAGSRGGGVGRQLLHALIGAARELGAHKVSLQVWTHNARAIALYRSEGFVEEGRLTRHYRRRNGELWDALIMGFPLDETSPGSPHGDTPLIS